VRIVGSSADALSQIAISPLWFPTARLVPLEESAIEKRGLASLASVVSSWPVLTSHNLTVLSLLVEANVCPSPEKATANTAPEWPFKTLSLPAVVEVV
jgi:hypothetical protein